MNSSPWAVAAMIVGISLLFLANWLPWLLPAQAVWNDDNAREFGKAAADYHNAAHQRAHKHSRSPHVHTASTLEPTSPELAAAKAEFDKQQAKLDGARSRVQIYKLLCQAVGIALAAGGAGLYLHLRIKGDR